MSVRALLRSAGFQAIVLPTLPTPQYVNEEGFEYDPADPISSDIQQDGVNIEDDDGDIEVGEEANEEEAVQEDGIDEDVAMQDEAEEEVIEPLMSLAESLIFPFSLVQTRNHHLTSLLPHIFSHPPIPSHSKPRAKPPPKGTFLFPTPGPLVHPLPLTEYHGPFIEPTASGSGSTPPPTTSNSNSSIKRPARPRKSVGADGEEPPAHEIECISRCTLSVGPISFPGTEIWIGRFVLPRQKKKERARPGERKDKRKSMAEESVARRARLSKTTSTPRPRPSTGSVSAKHQRQSAAVPRPGQGTPTPTPVRPPIPATVPTGTPTPAPARSTASPQLIQLVNQAASRHAWLSALIYKAAGSTANHEELEKLGKAVARLSRGEPIADLAPGYIHPTASAGPSTATISATRPTQPLPPNVTGPASAIAQNANAAPTVPAAANPSNTASQATPATSHAPPTTSTVDAADSDEEPDMKGPPQEGGGPLPLDTISSTPTSAPSEAMSSAVPPPLADETATSVPIRSVEHASPAPSPLATTVPTSSTLNNEVTQPQSQTQTTIPPPTTIPSTQSPPPPKPTYPLPPPFLLVAFKEHPTDKYLIPLGSHSFISRVGGDRVTGPKPQPELELEVPAQPNENEPDVKPDIRQEQLSAVTSGTSIVDNVQEISTAESGAVPPLPIAGGGRSRTRPSLGRGAKDLPTRSPSIPTPVPPVAQEIPATPVPDPAPDPIEQPKLRPTSGLPSLPGMKPSPGTILISTVVPIERWGRVDWDSAAKRLPFDNPDFLEQSQIAPRVDTQVKEEQVENVSSPVTQTDVAPSTPNTVHAREKRSRPLSSTKSDSTMAGSGNTIKHEKTGLFNLAAEDLMPSEGSVQPLTIRIEGLDDAAWSKFKNVMDIVEREEIANMLRCEPEHLDGQMNLDVSGLSGSKLSTEILNTIRPVYISRKKDNFSKLLTRVKPRQFLRNRLTPPPPTNIQEAMIDKWAPRPYPISTKPLYVVDTNNDDDVVNVDQKDEGLDISLSLLSPEPGYENGNGNGNRKKKKDESKVTFEMPVSLDALDERVEQGVAKQLSKGKGIGNNSQKRGEVAEGGGRKVKNKRGVEGGICQGCGKKDKIWRRGPGGRGTLCNSCGDLYTNGKLGPLKAPGAMAKATADADEVENKEEADATLEGEGKGEMELREEKEGDVAIEPGEKEQSTATEVVNDKEKHINSDNASSAPTQLPLTSNEVSANKNINEESSEVTLSNGDGIGKVDRNNEETDVVVDGGGDNTVDEGGTSMDVDP